ncbi:MAG: FAD-binding protein [Lachnospiraceae bacterium]|nr:FAD-binding protein [Lachnospiraceae bacterium]
MSEELKMKFYSNRSPKKGYSWETPPEPVAEADIAETVTTEVLILGGGISGLASGARCADMGLQVIVLDKNKNLFALAGQIAAVNSRIMEREGVPPVDKKILAADWMKMSGSRVQEELLWIFINRSAEGFHWMLDLAGEENLDVGVYEAYKGPVFQEYPCTHHIFQKKGVHKYKQWWGGWLACDILQTELLDQGGQVIRDTTALYLEKDETGRVTGCVAKCSDGAYRRYQGTKAVVVACGDCCENEEMLEAFCPIGARTKDRYSRPGNTGDGQKMLYWAGAAIDNMEWAPTIHTLSGTGYQGFFLHVNQQGNRFMNEDTWMQAKSVRVLMQPGGEWAYSILDSKFADEIGERFGELGGQGMMPLSLVGESYDRAKMVETVEKWIENGTAFVADTIEELAEKIGVPAENLKATVDRYNEIVASGDDTDFGKRSRLLTSVEQGPFYALKWGPKLLDVFGGALVNKNLNVIDPDAQPIPGLYAVGNCAGGMYHVDYPLLLNGNSYGRALAYACQLGDVLTGKL